VTKRRYPQTDVFVLCYNVDCRSSFEEIWDGVCRDEMKERGGERGERRER
jgi:hypothetical protein